MMICGLVLGWQAMIDNIPKLNLVLFPKGLIKFTKKKEKKFKVSIIR